LFAPVAMGAVVVVAYLASYRSRQVEQLRQAEALRLVTEERLRIARELHDVVSHSISVINVQAGVAAHVLDQQPDQAKQALLTIKATSKEALRELRGMLGVLRSVDEGESRAPAPGLAALHGLVEATIRAGLPTTVSVTGDAQRLPPAVDLTAYRIIQEALTNALRYAGPATARVQIAYADHQVRIDVVDDGQGSASAAVGGGLGIRGMQERAAAVGGQLEAGPLAEGGFRVHASLPVAAS
jgi:signal transduction histidine kinase